MAEEMIESGPWEGEEAIYSEADEAIAEAEDSAEDYRRPRRQRRSFQPARGVQGLTLRGRDGTRSVQFPSKLATVAETNRGLASQELARRALDERLEKLESRFRGNQKKDAATTGAVALAIGAGLSVIGAFKANKSGGFTLASWAKKDVTKMAAVVSVTQLATSGAKLAFNGRYVRSGFGIAADAFSVVQIALFTYGALNTPATPVPPVLADSKFDPTVSSTLALGTRIWDPANNQMYLVTQTSGGPYPLPVPA